MMFGKRIMRGLLIIPQSRCTVERLRLSGGGVVSDFQAAPSLAYQILDPSR